MSRPNSGPSVLNNVVVKPTIIETRMNYDSKRVDPIPRTERDLHSNLNIDNNGGALYSFGTFSIVDTYETEDEKQRRENLAKYGEDVTDAEMAIDHNYEFYSAYSESDTWDDMWDDAIEQARQNERDRLNYLDENYDDTWKYSKDKYQQYGTNSDAYIDMVESGEVIDDGMSCKMGTPTMGASVDADQLPDQQGNEAKMDADAPEADDPNAELGADGKPIKGHGAGQPADPKSAKAANDGADDYAIGEGGALSKTFAGASSGEPSAPEAIPEAAPRQFAVATPANAPAFQQSA